MADPTRCSSPRPPRWSVPLVGDPERGRRVVVEGHGRGDQFVPTLARVVPDSPPGPVTRPALPIRAPVIPWLSVMPFGDEERAFSMRRGDALEITCRAGTKPGGVVLSGGLRLPEGARLQMRWQAEAAAGFAVGLSRGKREPARMIAIDHGEGGLVVDEADDPQDEVRITVACPARSSRAVIHDLRFVPTGQDSLSPLRAAWAWRPDLWRDGPEGLVAAAQALGVSQLFISVEVRDERLEGADLLAAFVTRAHEQHLSVIVVEGDAAMALPEGRAAALARLAAIGAYQAQAVGTARLDGLQYDIEPYLLPDYLTDPGRVMAGWAQTISTLAGATTLPLDMVLPFWLASDEQAQRHVLPALAAGRIPITIMAYRTSVQAIQNAAEPLLAWSTAHDVRARVALESGPLPDDTTQTFVPAPDGLLGIAADVDGRPRAMLWDRAGDAITGQRFRFSHERVSPASDVSFLGDRARLLAASAALEPILAAWPSFAGLALHGTIP